MSTTIRNEHLFCLNCGGSFKLKFPLPIDEMVKKSEAFDSLHKDCEKTWTEPKLKSDNTLSVQEKATWWMENGERGNSSETMWNCLIGRTTDFKINYPYDPDDFSRCYKLLLTVPEWKNDLHKLKPLCRQWSNLVDNWERLSFMYEENIRTDWEKVDEIGMYEFMRKLIK